VDNLKYYNDSFAYDYDIFAPKKTAKTADILQYPEQSKRKRKRSKTASVKGDMMRKSIVAVLLLAAVFGSLFLRAEISSLKTEIDSVNREIVELESEVTRLSVAVERKISLANLEQAAVDLGMQKCEKSQVTYIKTNQLDSAETVDGKLTAEVE